LSGLYYGFRLSCRAHATKHALKRIKLNDDIRNSAIGRESVGRHYLEPVPEIVVVDPEDVVSSPLLGAGQFADDGLNR
jgi:hypothetical protein